MHPDAAELLRQLADELDRRAAADSHRARALRAAADRICANSGGDGALTTQEASERFDVPPATLRRWAKSRVGLAIPAGRGWRFSAVELQRLVSANREGR